MESVRWMTQFAEALARDGLKPMKKMNGKVRLTIKFCLVAAQSTSLISGIVGANEVFIISFS